MKANGEAVHTEYNLTDVAPGNPWYYATHKHFHFTQVITDKRWQKKRKFWNGPKIPNIFAMGLKFSAEAPYELNFTSMQSQVSIFIRKKMRTIFLSS